MHIRMLVKVVADEFDRLTRVRAASDDAPPEKLSEIDDRIESLVNNAESVFLLSAPRHAPGIYEDAKHAIGEITALKRNGSISPNAATFLSERIFEPLLERLDRLMAE